jgi:hypothetical protein
MTILPVGAELFHEDGRTDILKIIVAFRHFAKALKSVMICETFLFPHHCLITTGYPILDL